MVIICIRRQCLSELALQYACLVHYPDNCYETNP